MSNRIIYVAVGEFLGESKDDALSRLKKWERRFSTGEEISLDTIFPSRVAEKCSDVEQKIVEFEKLVGERTRIEVCEGFSSPALDIDGDNSIAIQNVEARLFSAASESLASEIANQLENILIDLGAKKTIAGWID